MSGCSLSAGGTSSWPSGRIPDIEKLDFRVGLPSDHGRVRTFYQPDYCSHKMDRNIRRSKRPSRQGTRHRDLPAHLNENSGRLALLAKSSRGGGGWLGSAEPTLWTPALMGADASAGVIALDEGVFTEGQ
jgi:hypothetical protein